MAKRPTAGRALFYTRDSGGKHEMTPGQYVNWAQKKAQEWGLTFDGTPERIGAMIRSRQSRDGDLFLDYGVTGNKLSRPGLDALIEEASKDQQVSHVLIPRRDRLARPDDPTDGMQLETRLCSQGITLVFMDRVIKPLPRGQRGDLVEQIVAMIDYNEAGKFRHDLAQKMIHAQIALAKQGFSTGGRPPYGFRRWLVRGDATPVRQLEEGEHVRMAGHHVAWLPGPDQELQVIRRILEMLPTMPASRVAATLTAEGVPTPDAGRRRKDRGVEHATSGVWNQPTVTNIARNKLLRAVVSYGRRSMGDQLRFTAEGPRPLEDDDRRPDGQPRVIANAEDARIQVAARFEPIVESAHHERLLRTLDERATNQRGKPRSKDPANNPLGARVFDMNCGWPLYRQPYNGTFRYLCGLSQQSHGAKCRHNHVDGPKATRFVLACIAQQFSGRVFREKLEEKIRALAQRDLETVEPEADLAALRARIQEAKQKRDRAAGNLALADGKAQYQAIASVFDSLEAEVKGLEGQLKLADARSPRAMDLEAEVQAAMEAADRLLGTIPEAGDLAAIGELFRAVNARLFLGFKEVKPKKRKINVVSKGVLTFGSAPPPVALYEGPTGRRALMQDRSSGMSPGGSTDPAAGEDPNREGNSSGNVSRGERI